MFATSPTPIVAPLGVELAAPIPAEVPATLDLGGPYFVALGTIEPRKDHGLLLDIWADFHTSLPAADIPRLLIIGRRGWKSEAVFSRLDNQGFTGQKVIELGDLSDGAVAAVLTRATALLAPSRAEGFGLPAAEAAARGVPVLACDLAVTREVLGHYPTYLPAANKTAWASKIKAMTQHAQTSTPRIPLSGVPDWTAHFNIVFNQF
jgi:glycosyltransferase involved in cell wall biosynthesis